ncbi:MAG: cation diffusion facilitator family transporter [Bacteroidales bacterium]
MSNEDLSIEDDKLKFRVQRNIVFVSVALLIAKFVAFFLTNSVGVLTDAMESIVNVAAGFISLYSLHISSKPKDKDHPFGHGKAELISASIEAILIMVAGGLIIFEGISRLLQPQILQKLDVGVYIIAAAGVVNWILGTYSIRVGKKYNSIALIAGGKHLHSDVYSTIGLVVGLVILYFTEISWIDSLLAIVFGTIILLTGISILRKTTEDIMDKADDALLEVILNAININRRDEWIDIHNLKVLKYGSHYYIELDLTLPWFFNIKQGHDSCVALANVLRGEFGSDKTRITIHTDPCLPDTTCLDCDVDKPINCINSPTRNKPFTLEGITQNSDSLV